MTRGSVASLDSPANEWEQRQTKPTGIYSREITAISTVSSVTAGRTCWSDRELWRGCCFTVVSLFSLRSPRAVAIVWLPVCLRVSSWLSERSHAEAGQQLGGSVFLRGVKTIVCVFFLRGLRCIKMTAWISFDESE